MELKPGYKWTEVGLLPEDWSVVQLADICQFENGDRSSNYPSPSSFVTSGIPFINAGQVSDGKVLAEKLDFITDVAYRRLGGGKVLAGDILFCLRGSLGKFGVVPDSFGEGAIASSLIIVRRKSRSLDHKFLQTYFGSALCRRMIETWAGGAAQPNLGGKDLAQFLVGVPPTVAEQRAIAVAVSDVDALTSSLDQLIAKKRDIKQATMQQLLTGKQRLPGFSGRWSVGRLSNLADIDPENLGSNTDPTYRFNYISLEDVDRGIQRGCTSQVFATAPSRARRILRRGDILVSTVRPGLQSHLLIRQDVKNLVCSTGFSVVRCKADVADPAYVYFHLFADKIGRQIESLLTGSNYPAINSADVRSFEIPFPSLQEQEAIATVLSDMDTEIAALEQKREKTSALKQGMMQELLTGRIRLI